MLITGQAHKKKLAKSKLEVDIHDAFGGVIDLTENSQIGKIMRKMLNAGTKDDPFLEANDRNDHRDWKQIEEFVINFAGLI